jgi:hypothetical protein
LVIGQGLVEALDLAAAAGVVGLPEPVSGFPALSGRGRRRGGDHQATGYW